MARLHSKRGAMSEINVVPYVDVMLVLLVIFMVTAPLVTPGVIDLPTVGKAGQPKLVPLEVVIKEDRSLSVRERDATGRIVSDRPVERGEFQKIFTSISGTTATSEITVGTGTEPTSGPSTAPPVRSR